MEKRRTQLLDQYSENEDMGKDRRIRVRDRR